MLAHAGVAAAVLGGMVDVHAAALRKPWRIGWLSAGYPMRPGAMGSYERTLRALRERGREPGRDFLMEAHFANNDSTRLEALAREVLAAKPDLIVAQLSPAAHALHRFTREVPIVLAGVGDPVGSGLVASLARPGGNITGISSAGPELAAKVLELLVEVKPGLKQIGALLSATDPFTPRLASALESGARALKVGLQPARVTGPAQYGPAFDTWRRTGVEAVFVQPTLTAAPALELTRSHRMPSGSFVRGWVEQGGLLAYASNLDEIARQVAGAIEAILQGGAKPADLPVQQITTVDLLLNRQTARAIGLALPTALLARASEVIE